MKRMLNRTVLVSAVIIVGLAFIAALVLHAVAVTLRHEAFLEAKRKETAPIVALIDSCMLASSLRAAETLAALPQTADAALGRRTISDPAVTAALTFAVQAHRASLVFIMNNAGTVTVSLPAPGRPSITGNNYRFRPYFTNAIAGTTITYPAVGVTTRERGFYSAAPIRVHGAIVGAAVIKIDAAVIDGLLRSAKSTSVLVSPDGIVFASGDTNWLLRSILHASGVSNAGKQFADISVPPAPFMLDKNRRTISNRTYSIIQHPLLSVSERGWRVLTIAPASKRYPLNPNERALIVTLMIFFAFLLVIIAGLAFAFNRLLASQREVKRQSAELLRMNEEVRQFASIASHDLREPLRLITNYLELLGRRYQNVLDDKGHEFISAAVRSGNKMSHLISDLLAYSRAGVAPKRMQTVHTSLIIDEVKANLRIAIEESGAVISSSGMPVITADPVQFVQLFQNIIENAIKFQTPGRKPVITITAERQSGQWLFSVADNGIGIPKEHLENIFLVFHRGAGGRGGTGLGLAIVKRVVESHGGTVWVRSEPGAGSTFQFTIRDAS